MIIYGPKQYSTTALPDIFAVNDLFSQTGGWHCMFELGGYVWYLHLSGGTLTIYKSTDYITWTAQQTIPTVKNAFFTYTGAIMVQDSDTPSDVDVYKYDYSTGSWTPALYIDISTPSGTTYTVYDGLYKYELGVHKYIIFFYDGNFGFYMQWSPDGGTTVYRARDTTKGCTGPCAHLNSYFPDDGWSSYYLHLYDSSGNRYIAEIDTTNTGTTMVYNQIYPLPTLSDSWPRLLIPDKALKKRFYLLSNSGAYIYDVESDTLTQFSDSAPMVVFSKGYPLIITKDSSVSGRFHFIKVDRCGGAMYFGAWDFSGFDLQLGFRASINKYFPLYNTNDDADYMFYISDLEITPFLVSLETERNSGTRLNFSVKELWWDERGEWVWTDYGIFKIKNISSNAKTTYRVSCISPALFDLGRKVYNRDEHFDLSFTLSEDFLEDMFSRYCFYLEAPQLATASSGNYYPKNYKNMTVIEALIEFGYELNYGSFNFSVFVEEYTDDEEWRLVNYVTPTGSVSLSESDIYEINVLKDIEPFTYVKVEGRKVGGDFPVSVKTTGSIKPITQICIAETPFLDDGIVESLANFLISQDGYKKIRVSTGVEATLYDQISVSYTSPRFSVSGTFYVKKILHDVDGGVYTYDIESFIFPFNIRYNEKTLAETGGLRVGDRTASITHYTHVDMYDPYFARPVQGAFYVIKGVTASEINNELLKLPNGGIAILPPGSYNFSETLEIPNKVKLIGYGAVIDGSASPLIKLYGICEIEGVEFNGNTATRCVEISGNLSTVRHCNFYNTLTDYYHTAVYVPSSVERVMVSDCRFNGKFLFGVESHGRDTRVIGCRFASCKYGVALYNTYNIVVGNIFTSMGRDAIYIYATDGTSMTSITGNVERYSTYSVEGVDSSYIMVIGNMFMDSPLWTNCTYYEYDHNFP